MVRRIIRYNKKADKVKWGYVYMLRLKNIKKVLVYEKDFMDVGSECDGAADGLQ